MFKLFTSDLHLEYNSYQVPQGNGELYDAPNEIWMATDYIACSDIEKISYCGVQLHPDSICPLAFYDANKTFIRAEMDGASSAHNVSGIAEVPSNAAYFKMSRYINPADSWFPKSTNYCRVMYKTGTYFNAAQVETNTSNITSLQSAMTAEVNARENADTAMSARIDNLVINAGGNSITEVVDARQDTSGVTHSTLYSRLNSDFEKISKKVGNIITVGTGKQYTTISAAITAANDGDIILISDGTYSERIGRTDKTLSLIGASRDGVILTAPNNNYSQPPLEFAKGTIMNMTIYATKLDNTTPAGYALHCDFQGRGVIGGYLYCDNVKFVNDNFRTVGLGLRGNAHIEFHNCIFECLETYEALYMHDANDMNYDINKQSVAFIDCTFKNSSSTKSTIEIVSMERRSKVAKITWQRNIVYNASSGGQLNVSLTTQTTKIDGNAWKGSSDWVLMPESALNTVDDLNY